MAPLSRAIAHGKLLALSEGAEIVRKELQVISGRVWKRIEAVKG